MNDSLWWDGLDGDNLACRPGRDSEEGFDFMCLFGTRILPTIMLVFGICILHVGWQQFRLARGVRAGTNRSDSRTRNARPSMASSRQTKQKKSGNSYNHAILSVVIAADIFSGNTGAILSGNGTIYASDTLPGRIGDAFFAIHCCTVWYLALIQIRGAKWFKGLVEMPTGKDNTEQTNWWSRLPSANQVLDSLQGQLSPFIALTLWVLLAVGVLPRAWFYSVGHTLTAGFGFRSFVAIATQRVTALRKIALMQNTVRGTADDKKRRKGILKSKTFSLMIDLLGVFVINVFGSASVVMFGSTFSSRQLIIHGTIMSPIFTLATFFLVLAMYSGIKKAKRRRSSAANSVNATGIKRSSFAGSQLSGRSVVEKSVVEKSVVEADRRSSARNNGGGARL